MSPSLPAASQGFYKDRHLLAPSQELRPESAREFRDVLGKLHSDEESFEILGDGQHARRLSDESRTVLRTDALDRVMEINEKSGLIRVEAGITWKALRQKLKEEGLSLQRYGLHPATATIGGMLARHQPGPAALHEGDLIGGCVAVGAHAPEAGDYRYLVAPRKASGPDLRYRFIGNQGLQGVILDATLVVWRPVSQRLLRWNETSLARAAEIMNCVFDGGIKHSGVHYSHKRQCLQLFLTAPGQLLRSRVRWIGDVVGKPDEIGDEEVVETRRAWLEARHPDRRSHPDAHRTRVFWLASSALAREPEKLVGKDVSEIEIVAWNAQRVEAFVRYGEEETQSARQPPPADSCWAAWPLIA